jgi:hypothetical protein
MRKSFCLGMLAFFLFANICSAGDIWIYDANSQQVGILVGMNDDYMDVFIPALSRVAGITIGAESGIPTDRGRFVNYGITYYNNSTCTGAAGLFEPVEKLLQYEDYAGNFHYGYAQSAIPTIFLYELTPWSGCMQLSSSVQAFPITIVPDSNIPFTVPIALPIKYQYQTDTKVSGGGKPPK